MAGRRGRLYLKAVFEHAEDDAPAEDTNHLIADLVLERAHAFSVGLRGFKNSEKRPSIWKSGECSDESSVSFPHPLTLPSPRALPGRRCTGTVIIRFRR